MGLVAGVLEQRGIATVVLSCLAEVTERVRPPRWLALPYPLGFPLGAAGDVDLQKRILRQAIQLLSEHRAPPLSRSFPPHMRAKNN